MLSATDGLDATVSQSDAVVDQYSSAAEQQYLAPMQDDLQAALNSFIADTAAISSSIGVEQSTSESSLGAFAGVWGTASTTVTTDSQQLLDNAQTSDSQASDSVSSAVGAGTTDAESTSLFDQNADLPSFAENVAASAFGDFGMIGDSGTTSSTGGSYGGSSGTSTGTSGTGTTTGGTTTSGGDSGSDAGSDDSTGDSDSTSTDEESSSGGGWQPFVLPEGITFEEVHLPAEQFADSLRLIQPSGQDTFSNITVTELSANGTTTTLTVTLSQTYLDAEHWMVSQSWTKEYTIHESFGEKTGLWSESTRHGLTSFSITVSLGFGVPDRPDVGRKKPASSDGGESGNTSDAAFDVAGSVPPPITTKPPVVPVGPVSTVSFSTSDSISKSVGDTHDDSDPTTGTVDKGGFSGSSNASASKTLTLTEFDVLQEDGTLGHTIQLTSASDRSAGLTFKGGSDQFEAEGSVLDGDGNPTSPTSHPFGTPWKSPGSNPPTDPSGFLGGTEPPTTLGGDGSRVQSKAGLEVGSAFSTGSYFLAEATTAVGADLEETDITGTAGMHTDYSGSIGVHDSLSLDLQDSDTTTGEYDYLSLGWSSAGHASRGLHFAYEMSLDDADLPTETDGSDSTPYTPDSPPPTTTATSGGTTGSPPTSSSPVTDTAGFDGSSSSGSTGGGTTGDSTSTPTPGKPVAELDSLSTTGGSSKVWVQEKVNRQTFSLNPSSNPSALPIVHTVKKALSVRIGGSSEITLTTSLVGGWKPTGTVTAKGGLNVAFMDASIDTVDYGFDADVPTGYTNTISEKQLMSKDMKTNSAGIEFDLVLTLSVTAAPTMSGTVTINIGYEEKALLSSFKHEQFVNNSTGDIYETWLLQQSIHRYWTTTTGGVGGTVNGLHTKSFTQNYNVTIDTATGTPPPPPPPTPTSMDTALDYLQTGLDVAGMIPILGEGADALNAGIHLGRGNYGEAALSLAAMVPLAGAGVTAAKFANRIGKAAVNNADKLDELAAGAKAICNGPNCFVAGTQVVVAVLQDRTKSDAVDPENAIIPEPDMESLGAADGPEVVPLETTSESHGVSVAFVAAGLALAVIRHTWTSSPQPHSQRRARRKAATIPVS